MPVQKQYMQVDFTGGLDTKTDQRVVIPGNFITANNVVYAKTGAVEKRPGMQFITDNVFGGTFLPNARTLASYNDELLMIGNDELFSLNSTETNFFRQDFVSEPTVVRSGVAQISTQAYDTCSAYAAGKTIYVWIGDDPSGATVHTVYASIIDDNGAIVYSAFPVSTGGVNSNRARVVTVGTVAIVTFTDEGLNNLRARTIDLANPTTWSAVTLLEVNILAGVSAQNTYDVIGMNTVFTYVYMTTTGNLTVVNRTAALPFVAAVTLVEALPFRGAPSLAGDQTADNLWIAYVANDGAADWRVRATRLTVGTLAVQTAAFNVFTAATSPTLEAFYTGVALVGTGTDATVIADSKFTFGTLDQYGIWKQSVLGTGATVGLRYRTFSGLNLYSRPFVIGGKTYVVLKSIHEASYYIADVWGDVTSGAAKAWRPVATFAPHQATVQTVNTGLMNVAIRSTSEVVVSVPLTINQANTIGSFKATFGTQPTTIPSNETLTISGGVPSSYDGRTVAEIGFLVRPLTSDAASSPLGGSLATGTYTYKVVYEWTDAKGQLHQSAPSDTVTPPAVVGPTGSITFQIYYATFTTKQKQLGPIPLAIRVVVYRAEPLGSTIYRRLSVTTFPPGSPFLNDPAIPRFLFTDNGSVTPATLATQPIIYTAQQLQHDYPPSAKIAITHGSRLWLAGVDDPTQLWPSKILTDGEVPNFSSDFAFDIHDGGEITGLGSLDDKLIVFKKDRIYAVFGDGPNDLGAGGDFVIQQVASDKGCTDALSVVLTPDGLMFRDSIGISMLSRGLEDTYFGAPVEDVVNAFPGVTSAKLHPTQPWVLFTLGPVVNAGVTVLYDYFHKRWAVWEYTDGSNAQLFTKSACIHKGKYIKTTVGTPVPNGAAHITRESTTNYTDDGVYVSMLLETAWLKFAGLLGFQRIRRLALLGKVYSLHNLELSLAHNYAEGSYDQVDTHDSTTLNWNSEQFATYIVQQKCSSMKVKIRDLPNALGSGTARGLSISGMGLEVGMKGNLFKLPIAQGG